MDSSEGRSNRWLKGIIPNASWKFGDNLAPRGTFGSEPTSRSGYATTQKPSSELKFHKETVEAHRMEAQARTVQSAPNPRKRPVSPGTPTSWLETFRGMSTPGSFKRRLLSKNSFNRSPSHATNLQNSLVADNNEVATLHDNGRPFGSEGREISQVGRLEPSRHHQHVVGGLERSAPASNPLQSQNPGLVGQRGMNFLRDFCRDKSINENQHRRKEHAFDISALKSYDFFGDDSTDDEEDCETIEELIKCQLKKTPGPLRPDSTQNGGLNSQHFTVSDLLEKTNPLALQHPEVVSRQQSSLSATPVVKSTAEAIGSSSTSLFSDSRASDRESSLAKHAAYCAQPSLTQKKTGAIEIDLTQLDKPNEEQERYNIGSYSRLDCRVSSSNSHKTQVPINNASLTGLVSRPKDPEVLARVTARSTPTVVRSETREEHMSKTTSNPRSRNWLETPPITPITSAQTEEKLEKRKRQDIRDISRELDKKLLSRGEVIPSSERMMRIQERYKKRLATRAAREARERDEREFFSLDVHLTPNEPQPRLPSDPRRESTRAALQDLAGKAPSSYSFNQAATYQTPPGQAWSDVSSEASVEDPGPEDDEQLATPGSSRTLSNEYGQEESGSTTNNPSPTALSDYQKMSAERNQLAAKQLEDLLQNTHYVYTVCRLHGAPRLGENHIPLIVKEFLDLQKANDFAREEFLRYREGDAADLHRDETRTESIDKDGLYSGQLVHTAQRISVFVRKGMRMNEEAYKEGLIFTDDKRTRAFVITKITTLEDSLDVSIDVEVISSLDFANQIAAQSLMEMSRPSLTNGIGALILYEENDEPRIRKALDEAHRNHTCFVQEVSHHGRSWYVRVEEKTIGGPPN